MPDSETAGYERRDVSACGVMWFGAALLVVLVVIMVALRAWMSSLARDERVAPHSRSAPPVEVPAPRLQTDPSADLAKFRAAEETKLNGYRWVDRKAGLIQIPIERAIELTAERGLPARSERKGDAR